MLTAKRKCAANCTVRHECCKSRVNTGDVRGREVVLADTSPKLRKQTQQSFFLSIILSSFPSLDLFLCTRCRGYTVAPDNRHTHSVGLLWTSDQPVAQTSTWQHTTLKTDRHPGLRPDSNLQSQHANGRRPTSQTARPLGSTCFLLSMQSSFDPSVWHLTVWSGSRASFFIGSQLCLPINKLCPLGPTTYAGFIRQAWHKI